MAPERHFTAGSGRSEEKGSLISERDELAAQLYRTNHRHTAPTCTGRPEHAPRRSSGTVRPRAGAELSEMGREADGESHEARKIIGGLTRPASFRCAPVAVRL